MRIRRKLEQPGELLPGPVASPGRMESHPSPAVESGRSWAFSEPSKCPHHHTRASEPPSPALRGTPWRVKVQL